MKNNRVIIVGAGVGGLTAAAYLCREDYDVKIIDKNKVTGGLVKTFQREGFYFDSGPRAFLNSGMLKPILRDLDIEWETVDNKVSLIIEEYKFKVESMESIHEYRRILIKLYPEQKEDIERIIKITEKLSEYTKTLYAFDNPYFVDYTKDRKKMLTQLLPWSIKLLYALKKFKQYSMPMEEYMKELTDNQSLTDIVTQIFFKGTPTYFALGYFYVWLDYFYPKGGVGILPELLTEKIESNNGKFILETKITEVIPSEKKIVDSNGDEYEYDHLIWAADLKNLYRNVNLRGLDEDLKTKIINQRESVEKAKSSESVFILYLGVDRNPSYFEERGGGHVFYTDTKEGLGEYNQLLKENLLEDFETIEKKEFFYWLDEFCNRNTYEISVPVLRDSSLAPVGKSGLMLSCLFEYEMMEKIKAAGWLDEFKVRMEDNIIRIVSKSLYKNLDKDIIFRFSSTPLTINSMIGSSGGAIVGWSFETESPVVDNLKEMPKAAITPIPDVYQSGQWAYAPAGVPVAMLTGWHAYKEIIKKK